MFRLIELSIGSFAIVKEDECGGMPMKMHGFIRVFENKGKYVAHTPCDISEMLKESGEIEVLKAEAIEATEEAVADEFIY